MKQATKDRLRKQYAARIVDEAGAAGGIAEVRRLAEKGWPEDLPLITDSPALRTAIREAAQAALLVDE